MGKTESLAQLPEKFEDALAELELIVGQMEGGQLPLEETMARFERGMKLVEQCGRQLAATEKRIEILMKKAGGEEEWVPLTDVATSN